MKRLVMWGVLGILAGGILGTGFVVYNHIGTLQEQIVQLEGEISALRVSRAEIPLDIARLSPEQAIQYVKTDYIARYDFDTRVRSNLDKWMWPDTGSATVNTAVYLGSGLWAVRIGYAQFILNERTWQVEP